MRIITWRPVWAVLLGAAIAMAPARAELIKADDPEVFKTILESRGWSATIVQRTDAPPYIMVKSNGGTFSVFFMTCTDHKQCRSVQYYLGFHDAKDIPLESLNEWNEAKRYARAYRDAAGDPVLEMDVNLDAGGVSRENVGVTLNIWTNLMDDYRKHLANALKTERPSASNAP